MDKRHLLPSLVHPKQAKVGDYVFVRLFDFPFVDIVQVTEVKHNGSMFKDDETLCVEGHYHAYPRVNSTECISIGVHVGVASDDPAYPHSVLLPPTKYRKQQYLDGFLPVVGAFTPTSPLPKYPQEATTSPHVVGRPELAIAITGVSRSASNYVEIRISVQNNGAATVLLGEYEWEWKEEADFDVDQTPFAYLADERFTVFQVEGGGGKLHLYPGRVSYYRVAVSNRAGAGAMRVYIPSGVLGGALGTYTMLAVEVPHLGADGASEDA